MKPQDILFLIVWVGLLLVKQPRYYIWAGLASLVVSIPLFGMWVFFTAERLTWYAAVFFLTYIVLHARNSKGF